MLAQLKCWLDKTQSQVTPQSALGKAVNYLAFSDTPKGATASAQIHSLAETAKVNGQEPYTWLCHVLERLPHASSVEDYEALLPWNCSPEMPR